MVGPTGCGKTEIARRMSKIAQAPFIKVLISLFLLVSHSSKKEEKRGPLIDIFIRQSFLNIESIVLKKNQT